MKADVYERVTNAIVAELEKGVRPWFKPWSAEHAAGRITRPLRANGLPYRGINVLMLWGAACARGYAAPIWMTFKQAQELGGHVRKGEKGNLVVYANTITKTETDENGDAQERDIPFMKGYTVFNVEQVEGLPAHFYALAERPADTVERIEAAERFFAATGADVRHGGGRAFYSPAEDRIQMPPFEAFFDPEAYYATLAHEMTHWTKGKGRLDRDLGRKRWGDAGYAMEELVAELGAAFVCADLAISPEPRAEHAAYIGNWLKVLKEDKRAIFSAAAHAQRAADFLNGLQPAEEEPQKVAAYAATTFPPIPPLNGRRGAARAVIDCDILSDTVRPRHIDKDGAILARVRAAIPQIFLHNTCTGQNGLFFSWNFRWFDKSKDLERVKGIEPSS